jgi:hypothetical protein
MSIKLPVLSAYRYRSLSLFSISNSSCPIQYPTMFAPLALSLVIPELLFRLDAQVTELDKETTIQDQLRIVRRIHETLQVVASRDVRHEPSSKTSKESDRCAWAWITFDIRLECREELAVSRSAVNVRKENDSHDGQGPRHDFLCKEEVFDEEVDLWVENWSVVQELLQAQKESRVQRSLGSIFDTLLQNFGDGSPANPPWELVAFSFEPYFVGSLAGTITTCLMDMCKNLHLVPFKERTHLIAVHPFQPHLSYQVSSDSDLPGSIFPSRSGS